MVAPEPQVYITHMKAGPLNSAWKTFKHPPFFDGWRLPLRQFNIKNPPFPLLPVEEIQKLTNVSVCNISFCPALLRQRRVSRIVTVLILYSANNHQSETLHCAAALPRKALLG